ncbi:MAG: hypothetical protein EOP20_11060 [Hyphomicrobiales bacterium]|nr:MAG: hypothetical protein EOP20_11060 [Hyphomicrobiales bacterium]
MQSDRMDRAVEDAAEEAAVDFPARVRGGTIFNVVGSGVPLGEAEDVEPERQVIVDCVARAELRRVVSVTE